MDAQPIVMPDSGTFSPISLQQVTAKRTKTYECDPNDDGSMMECGDYVFSFVLNNAGGLPLVAMQRLEWQIGDTIAATNFIDYPDGCRDAPWLVKQVSTSEVIEISFSYDSGGGAEKFRFDYPCGKETRSYPGAFAYPAPSEGGVTVRLVAETEGQPGTDWLAQGSTVLQDATAPGCQ